MSDDDSMIKVESGVKNRHRTKPFSELSPDALLTTRMSAKYLNIGERTVRQLMDNHLLKYIILPQSPKVIRYTTPLWIKEFLQQNEQTAIHHAEIERKAIEILSRANLR
jgi:hypothetical protein